MRLGVRWVLPASLGSLAYALGVVVFIRSRWFLSRAALGLFGTSGYVGFTRVQSGGRWVYAGSLGLLACARGSFGSFRLVRMRLGVRWVHPRSLGYFAAALGSFSLCRIVEFTRARPGGHWVLSRASWRSLGSSSVVGFTRVCAWVVGSFQGR